MMSRYISCLLLLLALARESLMATYTTDGSSGEVCGSKLCLARDAFCDGTDCRCRMPPFYHGNGFFGCYRKNEIRTEVLNDPRIVTYNNNSAELPFPCRYLLTHAVTEYKNRDRDVIGSCETIVHVFHQKARGKFFVHGVDVAIRVECNNGSRHMFSIRKYGTAENGVYNFIVNGTAGEFLPDGPFLNDVIKFRDPVTNLKVKCKIDRENNVAVIHVKRCGIKIRLRLYDKVLRRAQRMVPGAGVSINCAHHAELESPDRIMALPPILLHNGFDIKSITMEGMSPIETMLYRAYMSGVAQTQPDPNPACEEAQVVLSQCNGPPQIKKAFNECLWILRSPRFIKCHDQSNSGFNIQYLFNRCVDIFCGSQSCTDVIDMISQKCRDVTGYDGLTAFVSGSRCP